MAYRKLLFGKATLQDLPDDKPQPAGSVKPPPESGVLMRFSRPSLADYRVGKVFNPDLPLRPVLVLQVHRGS